MTKRYNTTKQWYAIHTYSGYEEKVAESIRQRAESLDMKDKIHQILVPKEKMIEINSLNRLMKTKQCWQKSKLILTGLTLKMSIAQGRFNRYP